MQTTQSHGFKTSGMNTISFRHKNIVSEIPSVTFNRIRFVFLLNIIVVLCCSLLPTTAAYALADDQINVAVPGLDSFVEQLKNGQADVLRGSYIPGILAASVVQQPAGMDDFVSVWENTVTQFSLASRLGSTGLLAHNDLAGKTFTSLQNGQKIYLVYGDGRVFTFIVSKILRYQASDPDSSSSSFIDLKEGNILASPALFTKIYNRPEQLIFQTCIDADDTFTWGRLFVIAEPASTD